MNKVDSGILFELNSNKINSNFKDFTINQSVWKKELEKRLYANIPKDMARDKMPDAGKKNTFSSSESELKADNDNYHNNMIKTEGNVIGESFEFVAVDQNKTSIVYLNKNHKPAQLSNEVPLPSAVFANIIEGGKDSTPYKHSESSQGLSNLSKVHAKNGLEIKPFNIKLLADGELIVRDYMQGGIQKVQIDHLVNQLQKMFDKGVNKLMINGDTIWEAEKEKLSANEYIIDLVY